ncbi:hypothetical protein BTS2_1918 [Bacillus sp. TS-2]|nr:hypothetical protein BTS2_1918 [Bacillus sp. TS-2]
MKIDKNRIILILCTVLYVFSLNWSYINLISPHYYYFGYSYTKPSLISAIISWSLAIVPSLWLSIKLVRPSLVVTWLLYLLVFVPSMFIPLYSTSVEKSELLLLQGSLLFALILIGYAHKIPLLKIKKIYISNSLFWVIIFSISTVFYLIIMGTFGFKLRLVSLFNVYDIRMEYREDVNRIAAYAINWQSKIINTLLIAWGLVNKKILIMAVGIFGQLIIFSITGHKSVFLSTVLIIGILICLQKSGRFFGVIITLGLSFVTIVSYYIDGLMNTITLSTLFVRRLILTPGLLTGYYFDYFHENPKFYLSHSIFKSIVDNPYSIPPPFLIGTTYFGRSEMAANANIWADAFANFGLIGIFVFSLILVIILWIFNSLSVTINPYISTLILGMVAWSMTDTGLLTSLLTHGVILALIVIYLMPSSGKVDRKIKNSI